MEVILMQDMKKIGKMGSVVKVKDGFARNFLLPQSLAVLATPDNLKRIEEKRKKQENQIERQKEQAMKLGARLNELSLTIPVQTHDEDKLYGSITAVEIINALSEEGFSELLPEAVILNEPIKSTGVYEIAIRLHPEVEVKIKLWVVKK